MGKRARLSAVCRTGSRVWDWRGAGTRQAHWRVYLFHPVGRPDVVPTKPRIPAPLAMEVFGICGAFRPGMLYLSGFQSFSFVQVHAGQQAVYLHSFVYFAILPFSYCLRRVGVAGVVSVGHPSFAPWSQIKWVDSVICILYRRFFAESGLPSAFRKFAEPLPGSPLPRSVGRCIFISIDRYRYSVLSLALSRRIPKLCVRGCHIGYSALFSYSSRASPFCRYRHFDIPPITWRQLGHVRLVYPAGDPASASSVVASVATVRGEGR